nr:tyrosine-type recombinase/integrase [Streptomyces cellostaticus]
MCSKAKAKAYRWHDLRHHYASVLIAGNENPKVVSRRLGHKDVAFTMRIYAHLFAEAEEQTRSVLDAAWAEPGETDRKGSKISAAPGTNPESGSKRGALVQVNA